MSFNNAVEVKKKKRKKRRNSKPFFYEENKIVENIPRYSSLNDFIVHLSSHFSSLVALFSPFLSFIFVSSSTFQRYCWQIAPSKEHLNTNDKRRNVEHQTHTRSQNNGRKQHARTLGNTMKGRRDGRLLMTSASKVFTLKTQRTKNKLNNKKRGERKKKLSLSATLFNEANNNKMK